jgi:uncharacterized membrane protein YsdA (DUF1294 family)
MTIFKILITYLIIINFISIIVTIYDKRCAVKGRWRVRESTLLLLSALGGSVGMFLTMQIIRHKTKHIKFMLGIPLIFICQCFALYFIWRIINV